jgi:hypothetical protein
MEQQQIEINPQTVMMIAEQALRDGWVQGIEKGYGTGAPTEDYQGVCVVGALRQALTETLRPQVLHMCLALPEYQGLGLRQQQLIVNGLVMNHVSPLMAIFRERIQIVLGGRPIEGWNDMSGRRKEEVLEAMRASLEIITQECLQAWDGEALSTTELEGVFVVRTDSD